MTQSSVDWDKDPRVLVVPIQATQESLNVLAILAATKLILWEERSIRLSIYQTIPLMNMANLG